MVGNGFAILKPGFERLQPNLENLLSENGWVILNKFSKRLSRLQADQLYIQLSDKDFYNQLCDYMSSGDIICYECYTSLPDPIENMKKIKDVMRDNFSIDDMRNVMHSSDSLDNVERESNICKM